MFGKKKQSPSKSEDCLISIFWVLLFLASSGAQGVKISVFPSVCPAQVCLKLKERAERELRESCLNI